MGEGLPVLIVLDVLSDNTDIQQLYTNIKYARQKS